MVAAGGGLGYRAGLDGLRGISIVAVLLFHADLGVAPAGFLGVSTFYTLSGFLITSLLLEERSQSGRIDLGRFWQRRARRLLPAALVGLLVVSATAPLFADEAQLARLRSDVPWALGYLLNWRLIAEHYSYVLLFNQPSPVQHFWSLAIEAQFYVVLPLLLATACLARRASVRAAFFGTLALASAGLAAWFTADGASLDRIYYGSDTRAGEILVGCALAAAMGGRSSLPAAGNVLFLVRCLGLAALAATFVSWFVFSLETPWLYRGGLGAYALVSAVLVLAALDESGPVGRFLRGAPLVSLGRISYGLYVYHWPVYLVLTPELLGVGAEATAATRVAVAIGLAWVSERYLERPVRRGSWLRGRSAALAAVAGSALVLIVLVPSTWGAEALSFRDRDEENVAPAPSKSGQLRYAFFGDSTMLTLTRGLRPWLREAGFGKFVPGGVRLGCGLAVEGTFEFEGKPLQVPLFCASQPRRWLESLEAHSLDVALMLVGPWDVRPRRLPGNAHFSKLGHPALDALVRQEILDAVDLLSSHGALVVWLTTPHFALIPGKPHSAPRYNDEVDRFNELLEEVRARRPDRMHVVDFAAYMRADPERHANTDLRQDGVHYTVEGAKKLSADWLGPRILEAQERVLLRRGS